MKNLFVLLSCFAASATLAQDGTYYFSRLAGVTGVVGGADGTVTAPRFYAPLGLSFAPDGSLYVADAANNTIRKLSPTAASSTIAGVAEVAGSADGSANNARFNLPSAVAIDASGNILVADTFNHVIRRITPGGVVTTLAGVAGSSGAVDGNGTAARFNRPTSLALNAAGDLFVSEEGNHTIRRVTPSGTVSTFAGAAGNDGAGDGTGAGATFRRPRGLAFDAGGTLYVADSQNHTIRRITPARVVSTVAGLAGTSGANDGTGSAARFKTPTGVAVAADGNVYVADSENRLIRCVTPAGIVTTLCGATGTVRPVDGVGSAAAFQSPEEIAAGPGGALFVSDVSSATIRRVTLAGVVTTFAGTPLTTGSSEGVGSAATFENPYSIAVDAARNLYVADTLNHMIRKITPSGVVSTLAGQRQSGGFANGNGSAARFYYPVGIGVSSTGDVFVTDSANQVIRRITPAGDVTTLAGDPGGIGSSDGTGSAARFSTPYGLAVDSAGTLYVADTGNSTVRRVTPAGVVTTIAGKAGDVGFGDGPGATARFRNPFGIAADNAGNLYVADTVNHCIRKIAPDALVSTLAGAPGIAGSGNGAAGVARFRLPYALAVDASSRIYVADYGNSIVRRISAGTVSTIGGTPNLYGSADGSGAAARFFDPSGVAVDAGGVIYVVDSSNSTIRQGVLEGPPVIQTQPVSQVVPAGSTVELSVNAASQPPLSYQWRKDGTSLTGATNSTLVITNVQAGNAGSYTVAVTNNTGSIVSNTAALTVTAVVPIITVQPLSQTAGVGDKVTFTVAASGTTPLTYRWRKNASDVSGGTAASLVLTSVQTAAAGSYDVVISNSVGSVVSNAALLSVVTSVAPTIVTGPSSVTATTGTEAAFTVVASGTAPLTYLWRRNGTPLTGATRASLTLAALKATDGGVIDVTISNLAGSVTASALLTVLSPPSITVQPRTQVVSSGQPLTLSVSATGTGPLGYRWLKNGTTIAGATTASFSIDSVAAADAGAYSVVVTNALGTVTSAVATLTVTTAGFGASHFISSGTGYVPETTVTIVCTMTYSGNPTSLGWQVLLPVGWSFVRDSGDLGATRPLAGQTDLLEWDWLQPQGTITFSYTVAVPAGQTGEKQIAALMLWREPTGTVTLLARPDPLVLPRMSPHSADSNHDFAISLLELTRVIELYNTRSGTSRTGRYHVEFGTEDGFAPGP